MPLSALRSFTPSGLPSTDVAVDSDALSPLGIKRGSTVAYIPFNDRYLQFSYHIKIKSIGKEMEVDKAFIVVQKLIYKGVVYDMSDIEILGVVIEKSNLRLIK